MNTNYQNSIKNPSSESQNNNIEQLLHDSALLFMQTGMPELAQRWQKILDNYHRARTHR